MSTEYGLFSDDGLIEGDFYSKHDAEKARVKRYPDDDLEVLECCPEHRDCPRICCEECDAEDEEAEAMEAEDDDQTCE